MQSDDDDDDSDYEIDDYSDPHNDYTSFDFETLAFQPCLWISGHYRGAEGGDPVSSQYCEQRQIGRISYELSFAGDAFQLLI